ncbi:membrane protein required for colicin V production [Catalinimonas alkaloidigena]|uniref:Membrane protein required for colicin V production n=1 Tax=Catalinimonas alkaloidigena TaxID=1075417 RepID=A0A1G9DUB1_9BACT|nr:CvpA family protein [Catalinimonas alkaloidigena]SDK67461.1 membrane protein required for colicin V production [Catalinimonas alkaloidigena]
MEPLDIILLVPLTWGAYRGFQAGLIVEVVSTLGALVGLVVAFALMDWGTALLAPYAEKIAFLAPFAAFIIIFLVVFWGLNRLALLLRDVIRLTLLGWLDRIAGALVGILKSLLTLGLLLWAAQLVQLQLPTDYTEGTFIYPFVATLGPAVAGWLTTTFPALQEWIKSLHFSA